MIVKMKTNDEGWEYFNCPKGVKVRELTNDQWKFVWSCKDTEYINIYGLKEDGDITKITMTLINIYNVQTIYTNSIVYLLNDDGKTIDKLN